MGVPDCTCHLSCYYYYTYSSAGAPKIAIEDSLDAILRFPGVGAESAVRWFERRARGGMGGGSAFRVGVASSRRGLHRLVSSRRRPTNLVAASAAAAAYCCRVLPRLTGIEAADDELSKQY